MDHPRRLFGDQYSVAKCRSLPFEIIIITHLLLCQHGVVCVTVFYRSFSLFCVHCVCRWLVKSYLILATWTLLWLDRAYALASLPSRKPLKSTSTSHRGSNDIFTVCMENAWEKVWRRRTPCTLGYVILLIVYLLNYHHLNMSPSQHWATLVQAH